MSGAWEIDAPSVGVVLNAVFDQVGDGSGSALDGSLSLAGESIITAASASCSGPVQSELYYYLEQYGAIAEEMVSRAGSAMEGCSLAVDAYLTGDLEMAAEAQDNATATDNTGAGALNAPH